MIQHYLVVGSTALFLGSIGAFFLWVSPLTIATVAFMLVGLMLMFGLGFQAGVHELALKPVAASPKFRAL